MKKYLIIVVCIIALIFGLDAASYRLGWFVDLHPDKEVTTFIKTEDRRILIDKGNGYEPFEIRGVDMGSGIPGKWSTDFAGDKEMYLSWFSQIKEMGANTIRVYTINPVAFYDALYEYNTDNPDPLYLLQGVWVDEYAQFSHEDGYSDGFVKTFRKDCLRMIDVIHGHRKIMESESTNAAAGTFKKDVSEWVIGYILGVEWEGDVTALTIDKYKDDPEKNSFKGEYLCTTEDATAFEAMLAYVGDSLLNYESKKYKTQKLLAFSNWPATDPFEYPVEIQEELHKDTAIDVERIACTDNVISGQFASYHVYPYYPCYINYMDDWSIFGIDNKLDYVKDDGIHSYQAYLHGLAEHHKMPVIISEFGIPSSRGMACIDPRLFRNQGNMSEKEQGEAIVGCYEDIMEAGCAGSCLFSWQDEWFKRTWNTLHAVDLKRNPYWSDYQTNEQFFGVLTFDPGNEESVCTVDGNASEWSEGDLVIKNEADGIEVSMKGDEKFAYFLVKKDGLDFENDNIYIPIDTTPKTGSTYCKNFGIKFDRAADFVLCLNGKDDSRLMVQERYDAARSTYAKTMYGFDTYIQGNIPDKDTPEFVPIMFPLQEPTKLVYGDAPALQNQYETGKLRYGNANPDSEEYDSAADFISEGDYIEIRLPWQLLNFSDPSKREIHDDYFKHYGVAYITIDEMYIGVAETAGSRIHMAAKELNAWDTKVTYHERLKDSYYAMQAEWTKSDCYAKAEDTSASKEIKISMETDVPALMYHDFVSREEKGSDKDYSLGDYAIWAEDFEKDLQYIRDNGYTTITCQQLIDYANGKGELPDKPVLLTIDDGRYGVYKEAWPLLKKYGMTATLAAIGASIDTETIEAGSNAREYLFSTWDEIKEMQDSGAIEVISHSYYLHDDEDNAVKIGAAIDESNTDDRYEIALKDYFKVSDMLNKKVGSFTKVLSYPYSARSTESDRIWSEIGYQLLLCGDAYTVSDSIDRTIYSARISTENIRLVPRIARYADKDFEHYLDLCRTSVEDVLNQHKQ